MLDNCNKSTYADKSIFYMSLYFLISYNLPPNQRYIHDNYYKTYVFVMCASYDSV